MNRTLLNSAIATLAAILNIVRATAPSPDVGQQCDELSANSETVIRGAVLGDPLKSCVRAMGPAGATFDALGRARQQVADIKAAGTPAAAIKAAALQMILAEECRALAAAQITSRQDADAWLLRMNDAFEPVEDLAADQDDVTVYRSILAHHAAVANDLVSRGRPLPQMVTFSFAKTLPSLAMAAWFYGDGDRAQELEDENHPVHPLFMPRVGRALAR
jgi:prophage DNA circulation protein